MIINMTHVPQERPVPDEGEPKEERAAQAAETISRFAVRFTDPTAYEREPANIRDEWKQLPDGLPEEVRQPFGEGLEETHDEEQQPPEAASLEPPEFHDPSTGWTEVERRRDRRRESTDRRQHNRGQQDRRQEDRRQTPDVPQPTWERPDIPEAFPYGIAAAEQRKMEPDHSHDHTEIFTTPQPLHDGDEIDIQN